MRLLFFFSFLSSFVWCQLPASPNKGIPDDWLGSYQGTMEIFNAKGLQQVVPVTLDLHAMTKPNYWTYNMSFQNPNGESTVKAYQIYLDEHSKKLWMDEGDSLLIEMTQMGNCLFDHYELSGMFFNSSLCKQEEQLLFEITGGNKQPSFTSPFIKEADGVVESMKVSFLQRVVLRPKK